MTVETLEIENQEICSSERADDSLPHQSAEVTPLPLESFKLIGGGSGVSFFG